MRSFLTLLTALLFFIAFFSCKKSNSSGSGGGSLQGTWKFVYLTGQDDVSATSGGITEVSKSTFSSSGASGTITFTADSATVANLSYTENANTTAYVYQGSTLIDSVSTPSSISVPATNEAVACQQIGSDSLYFPGGSFATGGSSGAIQSSGGHYTLSNDTLVLTESAVISISGESGTATEITRWLKQ